MNGIAEAGQNDGRGAPAERSNCEPRISAHLFLAVEAGREIGVGVAGILMAYRGAAEIARRYHRFLVTGAEGHADRAALAALAAIAERTPASHLILQLGDSWLAGRLERLIAGEGRFAVDGRAHQRLDAVLARMAIEIDQPHSHPGPRLAHVARLAEQIARGHASAILLDARSALVLS